jgi:hypothetical protein
MFTHVVQLDTAAAAAGVPGPRLRLWCSSTTRASCKRAREWRRLKTRCGALCCRQQQLGGGGADLRTVATGLMGRGSTCLRLTPEYG